MNLETPYDPDDPGLEEEDMDDPLQPGYGFL